MKKTVLFIIILIIFIMISSYQSVFADAGISDIVNGADDFVDSGKVKVDTGKLKKFSNGLSNALIAIGTAIAVIYSSVLGIKYMLGSLEEKAEIKESIVPFIIGCMILFGAFTIWKIIITIGNSFSS